MWDFTPPHLPTLFILHITRTENQTSLLCVTLSVCRTTAHTWQAWSKRRERTSRNSPWFLSLGLIRRSSSISLQAWIMTCTSFLFSRHGGPCLSSDQSHSSHTFLQAAPGNSVLPAPSQCWGFNYGLFDQWLIALCCLAQPPQLSINGPICTSITCPHSNILINNMIY